MTDVRASTVSRFKRSLFNLRIWALYIKVSGVFDSFRLEFDVEAGMLEDRASFAIKGLTETLR